MADYEPLLGEIALFATNFVPRGWAPCDGQLLAIAQNTALFSIVGAAYGGDGRTTFGLPDLRGVVALGVGQGPGLTNYSLGEMGGEGSVTLLPADMPGHTHAVRAGGSATSGSPVENRPAGGDVQLYNSEPTSEERLSVEGQTQPHSNEQPSLGLQYCIALTGTYPSRS
ncbi:phage tail protein [Nocardioides yefusunii]|uniref:Phage tail protein n=1 Tax=Nocardioides yefusunii TaxID=2500546 RepID=A0ABW1QX35_9ACTN|nr:tail fiber protein [Nocardioides yefusunii]